ncbi:TIGR02186 family protein [Ostreiculturibacter nitratireducens]|uniref:TIGR02186 family protein n=1 Tax=Ostreiculturibacter nitratireducens TaxID=3075226 RepID=UPI0031B641B5
MLRILLALLCLALPARAEEIVAGLSQDRIAITASFDGSEILVYGAVKRDRPVPPGGPLQAIVTVEGPAHPVTVRRKSRVAGIWVNTESVDVDLAPSFYAVASTGPLRDVLSQVDDLRYSVSVPRAIRSVGAPMQIQDAQRFSEALIRIRTEEGRYSDKPGKVDLSEDTLLFTRFELPANLIEGDYKTRIFLTRDRAVVDLYEAVIHVQKVGLERWLYMLSQNQPLVYGLLSIFLAVAAGYAASAVFRFLRS